MSVDQPPGPDSPGTTSPGLPGAAAHDRYLAEILGQPEALRRAGRRLLEQRDALRCLASVSARARQVVLTGMGGSYDALCATASILGGAGILATTVNTAELLHFRRSALGPDTLLVAVSQSGASAEVVALGEHLAERRGRHDRRSRPCLVAVTNGLGNRLAEAADVAFDIDAGEELAPSSMTFAATLVVLAALTEVLAAGGDAGAADLDAIATRVADETERAAVTADELLRDHVALEARMGRWLGSRTSVVLVGRGVGRAAAELAALSLKEAAGIHAEALDAAEFRHGPLELAGPDLSAVVFAIEPATADLDLGLADELHALATRVLAVAPSGCRALAGRAGGTHGPFLVELGAASRSLVPAVAVIPFQLLAHHVALARGLRPGEFRRGSKITIRP